MAERKRKTSATATKKKSRGFTDEERAAMQERARELKAEARKADGEREVLAKIGEMEEADRAIAERLHEIVEANAPELSPRTWYGMPAYARDGKVVCFFQSAQKFKTRYATLGFSDKAHLDEGSMWPTSFALKKLTAADKARMAGRTFSSFIVSCKLVRATPGRSAIVAPSGGLKAHATPFADAASSPRRNR
jgi:uncharacterized protein YdhG (YjbR/CyaY superfamily)